MSQLRSNAEKTARRLHDEMQQNPDVSNPRIKNSESWSDLSFTVQKDTEVIHREIKGGTKTNCYLKENQSEFSETRRLKDWAKKHSKFAARRRVT